MCVQSPPASDICIMSNSDIAGIGVRVAIYLQNFLSFAPALFALGDERVSKVELDSLETQSTGILITAFAILLSVAIQSPTGSPISNFHAALVLNLSWMNNTNTFIYFILRCYSELEKAWGDMERDKRSRSSSRLGLSDVQWKEFLRRTVLTRTSFFGTLHLSLMAAVGIWLWLDPADFQQSPCCAMQASLFVFGGKVSFESMTLRVWSLIAYILILIPYINLILPMMFFLSLYITVWRFHHARDQLSTYLIAVRTGLAVLFFIDASLLIDIEIAFAANRFPFLGDSEFQWSFGQTLALLVLMVPIRDIYDTFSSRRPQELTKDMKKMLRDGDIDDAIIGLIRQGANLKRNGGENFDKRKKNALFLVVDRVRLKIVKLWNYCAILTRIKEYDEDANQKTALSLAVEQGRLKIVKELLRHRAIRTNLRDYLTLASYDLAFKRGHRHVILHLEKTYSIHVREHLRGGSEVASGTSKTDSSEETRRASGWC